MPWESVKILFSTLWSIFSLLFYFIVALGTPALIYFLLYKSVAKITKNSFNKFDKTTLSICLLLFILSPLLLYGKHLEDNVKSFSTIALISSFQFVLLLLFAYYTALSVRNAFIYFYDKKISKIPKKYDKGFLKFSAFYFLFALVNLSWVILMTFA